MLFNMLLFFVLLFCMITDLHLTGLTHTDLKPENVLFVSSDYNIYYDARKVSLTVQIIMIVINCYVIVNTMNIPCCCF